MPEAVVFQTKPELAWAMLERARTLGMPGHWVTAETVYGQDPLLRAWLDGVAAHVPGGVLVAADHAAGQGIDNDEGRWGV